MIAQWLNPSLCAVAFFLASPAYAYDVNKCRMVADGRAAVISFEAEMANGEKVTLKGLLSGPGGVGPFKSMVILPGSIGPRPPSCYGWVVEKFVSWGFVTLMVVPIPAIDASGNERFRYGFADLGIYAYGAASALAALPEVDPARMVLWGHSRGGGGAIYAVTGAGGRQSVFRAAIAAAPWPGCPAKAVPPTIPLLVLVGGEDTEAPADWCMDYAAHLEGKYGFEFLLLPNAGHAYWSPKWPDAAELAEGRLKTFLAKHAPDAP